MNRSPPRARTAPRQGQAAPAAGRLPDHVFRSFVRNLEKLDRPAERGPAPPREGRR